MHGSLFGNFMQIFQRAYISHKINSLRFEEHEYLDVKFKD